MSGRTGKMTAEALAARGPRMVLGEIRLPDGRSFAVIYRENAPPFSPARPTPYQSFVWAKSYTLSYLLKIGRSMTWL